MKRNLLIDVLKGIATLAVLLGHAIQRGLIVGYENNIIFKIIYSFHMPLFILLSGFSLCKYTKEYNKNFLKKRFCRLIIPTIVWNYLIYFFKDFWFVGIRDFIIFPDTFLGYTKTLILHPDYIIWFWYVVFICDMIYYLENIILKEKMNAGILIVVNLIISGVIYLLPNTYFGIYYLQIYFPIFSLGYFVARYFEKISKYLIYFSFPSLFAYLLLFPKYNVVIDNKIVFYLISTCAIIIIYNIFNYIINTKRIEKINNALALIGRRSLEIYLCQCICLNIGLGTGIVRIVTIFITATTLSILLSYITNNLKILKLILYGKY